MATRLLVVAGGHPYDRQAFEAIFADDLFASCDVEFVVQPDALDRLRPGGVDADIVVFYDMPGLRFTRADPPVEFVEPPAGYISGLRRLLTGDGCERVGMVFMHHAIASWPTSHEFAQLLGGRFLYQPGSFDGTAYPDSGYVLEVDHTVEVLDAGHPICAGLPASFDLTDELYLFPVLDGSVHPLMRTASLARHEFFSADAAVRGRKNDNDGWSHPPGSDLVAWTRSVGDAELTYLQFGDGPSTYRDPWFRRIVANAVAWADPR
ncbi:MAG: type 1 glutamine amidotransferase [Candidatus Aldehydirespiratoraceae bacterium]|jgi:type 1 glutamine amidotransferase